MASAKRDFASGIRRFQSVANGRRAVAMAHLRKLPRDCRGKGMTEVRRVCLAIFLSACCLYLP